MKNKTDLTVVIPVKTLETPNDQEMLTNAIFSVSKQTVKPDTLILVLGKAAIKDFKTVDKDVKSLMKKNSIELTVIENDIEVESFQNQMNVGVSNVKTEWFTFLEVDDEFSAIWVENAVKYRNKYTDVGMFLPIVVDIDSDKNFSGLTNEVVWAAQFSNEMGILDLEALNAYQNFNIDGMVIKKSTYESLGGLKESMKLTFTHEFFLRLTYNGVRIMTIPKLGYKHLNQREGSLFKSYQTEMGPDEVRWWTDLSKKEYYHIKDRKITYERNDG